MKKLIAVFSVTLVSALRLFPCTGFTVDTGDRVYFCNNEDWNDFDAYLAFYPPKPGEFGRIVFEFAWPLPLAPGYITDFGGINDQGLAFDEYAHADSPLRTTLEKPYPPEEITQLCLKKCSRLEEVLAIYKMYNLADLRDHQTMYGDARGQSAIIEGDHILMKEGSYQICTNFMQSQYEGMPYPCTRYTLVDSKLTDVRFHSILGFRLLLQAVHSPGPKYFTQYSNIYELTRGEFILYYFHNYREQILMNVKEELRKGGRRYHLPSLFAYMNPLSPSDGERIEGGTVRFTWTGSPVDYELFYSDNPGFTNAIVVKVPGQNTESSDTSGAAGLSLAFFPLFLAPIFVRKQKRLFISIIVVLSLLSCMTTVVRYPTRTVREYSYTAHDLEKGATYYWKIQANASGDFTSVADGGRFIIAE